MSAKTIANGSLTLSPLPAERTIIDPQYLNADQVRQLIQMFDSPEAYQCNFSAIKAIARGLYKLILDGGQQNNEKIKGMFDTVNNLQGILLLDDMNEVDKILGNSGLMPDPWQGFRKDMGGDSKCAY